jgi:hypothetical protein
MAAYPEPPVETQVLWYTPAGSRCNHADWFLAAAMCTEKHCSCEIKTPALWGRLLAYGLCERGALSPRVHDQCRSANAARLHTETSPQTSGQRM